MKSRKLKDIPKVEYQPLDPTCENIEIVELDSLYKRAPQFSFDPSAPHRVQFNHLIYISKGTGQHFIDFNQYSFKAGSFLFVNKHQVHAFDFKNKPRGLMILFTQEFLESIRVSFRVPVFSSNFLGAPETPVIFVEEDLKISCEHFLLEIKKASGSNQYDDLLCQLLFTSLLLKLDRARKSPAKNILSEERIQKFANFVSLLETHFITVKDATWYANEMSMTYKSLNQLCKLATNQTPKQLIDAHIILEAKRKLAIEDIQVSQLAYELGFEEVSNFVKYFKKHTLVTPLHFKETLKG
jgi:AraC family transcriptional regulator, transcriptional activator of pobA